MIRIALDAMGGDNAPDALLEGAAQALGKLGPDTKLVFYGDAGRIGRKLQELGVPADRTETVATSEVISCNESPTAAVRKKKDSSMVRALTDVSEGKADCIVSAGSTGALLTGANLIIRRIPGVKRPALASVLPTLTGKPVILLDCGANTDCKPEYLVQFALMGSAYLNALYGVKDPRIGLLNNGAEEEKGNELTKEVYQRLKAADVNFAGNCEARDLLSGAFDVVTADGFDGNVVIKTMEGTAGMIFSSLKTALSSGIRSKLGAFLCHPALRSVKKQLDYTEIGGAPFLGTKAGVIKAHGSSNAKAFCSAILQAEQFVASETISKMTAMLSSLDAEAPAQGDAAGIDR